MFVPLPAEWSGPARVELAKLDESIPAEHGMRGGSIYELKWDGYGLVAVHGDTGVSSLWSRNGKDLTARYPRRRGRRGRADAAWVGPRR